MSTLNRNCSSDAVEKSAQDVARLKEEQVNKSNNVV